MAYLATPLSKWRYLIFKPHKKSSQIRWRLKPAWPTPITGSSVTTKHWRFTRKWPLKTQASGKSSTTSAGFTSNTEIAESVEAFNNALKLKPGEPEIISGLGVALTKSGKNTEAMPYLTQVVEMKRYIQEDFYNLGEAYANEGQWSKAAEIFKTGAELKGLDPNGYFYWGTMLFNEGKIDEAFDVYQIAKKKDLEQNHWGTSLYLADIYRLRGDLTSALGSYRQVLKVKPDHVESLFHAGYICFKLGQLG